MKTIKSLLLEAGLRLRVLRAAVGAAVGVVDSITPVGRLYVTKFGGDGSVTDYGLVSTKVVTTAGVNAMADAFKGTFVISDFKFHASGTGTVAEAVGDTALGTEAATRATGTQIAGAAANIYRTVGTIDYTATLAITEHGVLSAATGGTLLDRSVFAAINVQSGDSIQFTYDLTLPAGS